MKNKKVLSMVAALGLVAVVGIGGTLAYFNDQTDTLTNTFTMAEQGIEMELWESSVMSDGNGGYRQNSRGPRVVAGETVVEGEAAGIAYEELQPGADVYKDPTVTIKANSVNCYVYASIQTDNDAKNTISEINDAWEVLETSDNGDGTMTTYYVYGTVEQPTEVEKNTQDQNLTPLFTNVEIATDVTDPTTELGDIIIKSAAVQSSNIQPSEANNEGLRLLKGIQ